MFKLVLNNVVWPSVRYLFQEVAYKILFLTLETIGLFNFHSTDKVYKFPVFGSPSFIRDIPSIPAEQLATVTFKHSLSSKRIAYFPSHIHNTISGKRAPGIKSSYGALKWTGWEMSTLLRLIYI